MPAAQRVGDANSAGGVITASAQGSVYVNGILVSVDGSGVSPHVPFIAPHIGTVTSSGSSTVKAEGIAINRDGDADSCGHPRVGGSGNVNIGG